MAQSRASVAGDGGRAGLLVAQDASAQVMMGMTARLDQLQRGARRRRAAPLGFGAAAAAPAARLGGFMLGLDRRIGEGLTLGAVGGWSSGHDEGSEGIASRRFAGGHVGAYVFRVCTRLT